MNPLILALIPPILYALSNHIDKHLIERYLKGGEIGALIILSALFGVVLWPIFLVWDRAIFTGYTIGHISILMITGALLVGALILYFYALADEETSTVVPFFETIPVFTYIIGLIVLGEVLSRQHILAGLLIVCGAALLSYDWSGSSRKFKLRLVALMLGSSVLYACMGVLFKFAALNGSFPVAVFWGLVGADIAGLILFVLIPSWRRQFIDLMRRNSLAVLGLNASNELITLMGDTIMRYAVLLAPVAVISAIGSLQSFFVLVLGVVLTLVFPHGNYETLTRAHLLPKIIAIVLIVTGSVMFYT